MPTKIEWVINPDGSPGETLNPLGWGCFGPGGTKEHPKRCSYCYAARIAKTRPNQCDKCKAFEPHLHAARIDKPFSWRKPRAIFWQDMGDLFHAATPESIIRRCLSVAFQTPRHRHIFLTKNPKRLLDFAPFPDTAAVGVTATNQVEFFEALDALGRLAGPSECVIFVSCEPILSPIFSSITPGAIDWIIAGAETWNGRPTGRTLKSWVLDLCSLAGAFEIPIFVKENVRRIGKDKLQQWPEGMTPARKEEVK